LSIESSEPILNDAFHRYFSTSGVSDPDLVVETGAEFAVDTSELSRHDLWFYGAEGLDLVYYEDEIFGREDRLLLKGLFEDTTVIRANTVDRLTPRSRGSVSDLLEIVLDYKFIQRGYTTLHSASLSKDGKAILLAGFPNVGKTLSTLYLLKQGFSYMGDDNGFICEDGTALAYPSTSSIGYHDFLKFIDPADLGRVAYYRHLARVWPMQNKVVERLFDYPEIYLPDIGTYSQGDTAETAIACCLEIGERGVESVVTGDLTRKILTSTDYSRPRIWQNPFMWVHAYFNDLDFDGVRRHEREIVEQFLSETSGYVLACQQRDWDTVLDEVLDEIIEEL
jgi:hypothetical protein